MSARAVGYVRVSTEMQVEDGLSMEAQRREIAAYCERHGYAFQRHYADEGVSAHTEQIARRPALAQLLADAKQGAFDLVIVHTLGGGVSALAVYDTAARAAARPAPCNTGCAATVRYPGRRGSALKRLREARGVGQAHLACALGLRRPELVPLEHEAYGALPRGFSTRYQAALETIADGEPPCFAGCGCRAVAP